MKIISFEELREKLGGDKAPHRATIDRMIARGEFVQPVVLSPRRVGFIEHEVDAWIESRKQRNEAAS